MPVRVSFRIVVTVRTSRTMNSSATSCSLARKARVPRCADCDTICRLAIRSSTVGGVVFDAMLC